MIEKVLKDVALVDGYFSGNRGLGFGDEVDLEGAESHFVIADYHVEPKGGQFVKFHNV